MARTLIVEDNQVLGDLLTLALECLGYDVTLATSGAAALELMAKSPFEIVFSDIYMKAMNGFELIARIKETHPQTVYVFMSGEIDPDIEEQAMEYGALAFLQKPVTVDAFQAVLKRALKRVERVKSGKAKTIGQTTASKARTMEDIMRHADAFLPGEPLSAVRTQFGRMIATNRHALIETQGGTFSDAALSFVHKFGPQANGPLVIWRSGGKKKTIDSLLSEAERGLLVFLNVDELEISAQEKLAEKLSASHNIRVVATTAKPTEKLVAEGRMSGRLSQTLTSCVVNIPILHELGAAVPTIMAAALQKSSSYPFGETAVTIDAAAAQALCAYSWPNGFAELRSVANLMVARLNEPRLCLSLLPEHIGGVRLPRLNECLREAEARHVELARAVTGSLAEAAERLGVSVGELESYEASGGAEPFFILKNGQPVHLPPRPATERLLVVCDNALVRETMVAALSAKAIAVAAVPDGLAAIAAVVIATRPFSAVIVASPHEVMPPAELAAQLARLAPQLRLGLVGELATAAPSLFHTVVPAIQNCEDVHALVATLLQGQAERPAA